MSIHSSARAALTASILVVLALLLAGSASAERPGWFSNPSISGSATVGATLLGSDGGVRCEPGCIPAGPSPERAGIFLEWVSCTGSSPGGADRPTGGLPDDPRPAPGCVSRGAPAAGATSYVVRPEDAGRWIQLHVLATNHDCGEVNYSTGTQECNYSTAHGYSATVGPVPGSPTQPSAPPSAATEAPNMTAYPSTSGEAKEGATLTATSGSWTSSPTGFGYQWKRCAPELEPCVPIAGANRPTYVLGADDVGLRVQVLVTASNAKGSNSAASFPSEIVASTAVAPASTVPPAIAGIAEDRQTLTAGAGEWSGTQPLAFAYQWLRCPTAATTACTPIGGATSARYTVVAEDLGARLAVAVTASGRGGSSSATSAPTAPVSAARPRPGSDRLAIEDIVAPNALVVAAVNPGRSWVRARGTLLLTVRVTDRRGFLVEGARVAVTAAGGGIARVPVHATDGNGVALVPLRAAARLPRRTIVLAVTAAKPGEAAVAASRRLTLAVRR